MPRVEAVDYADICASADAPMSLITSPQDTLYKFESLAPPAPASSVDLAGVVPDYSASEPRPKGRACLIDTWWNTPVEALDARLVSLGDVACHGGRPLDRSNGMHTGGNLLVHRGKHLVPDSFFVRGSFRSLPRELVHPISPSAFNYTFDAPMRRLAGPHLFLGNAFGHFGHFLLEGLSRLWALRHFLDLPVVLYNATLASWQMEILAALGLESDRLVLLDEPAIVERLIIPSAAYDLHVSCTARMGETWDAIAVAVGQHGDGTAQGPERIYLSRSLFPHNRRLNNEHEVEAVFAELGFSIIHPQTMPILDQIKMAAGADVVAGAAGSAMYLSAFQAVGARRIVLASRGFAFRDDELIARVRAGHLAYFVSDVPEGRSQPSGSPRSAIYNVDTDLLRGRVRDYLRS